MSCTNEIIDKESSQEHIFQSFWKVMDERYVFFKEKNLDWDSIYTAYFPQFKQVTSDSVALVLYDQILLRINDKHVSIYANDRSYAGLFSDTTHVDISFGKVYSRYGFSNISQLEYLNLAQLPNNIGYLRILPMSTVESGAGIGVENYNYSNGYIVDLRDCTGGTSSGIGICDIFINDKRTIYNTKTKSGKGRNEFTDITAINLQGIGLVDKSIPVVVLINDYTFSMGNIIAYVLKDTRNCTFVGSKTGGGGGSVSSVFLPSGWWLNYTQDIFYTNSMQCMEDGLNPDIEVNPTKQFWTDVHQVTGEDPQLEMALEVLKNSK